MRMPWLIGGILLFAALQAHSGDAINMELSRMVGADQMDRRKQERIDWAEVAKADAARRKAVLTMLEEGKIKAAIDYENAALIFHHGISEEDYRLANALATISVALEPDRQVANWLRRATWDRLMISMGRLQWYGTQSDVDKETGEQRVSPIDPLVK